MDNSEFLKGMKRATAELIALEKKRMKTTTLFLKSKAVERAPSNIGFLRASMVEEVELTSSEIIGRVGNSAIYAPYVHQGTGIYAKDGSGRKSAWRYYVPIGKYKGWHFTKGQKPQPFLKEAKDQNLSTIKKLLGG